MYICMTIYIDIYVIIYHLYGYVHDRLPSLWIHMWLSEVSWVRFSQQHIELWSSEGWVRVAKVFHCTSHLSLPLWYPLLEACCYCSINFQRTHLETRSQGTRYSLCCLLFCSILLPWWHRSHCRNHEIPRMMLVQEPIVDQKSEIQNLTQCSLSSASCQYSTPSK